MCWFTLTPAKGKKPQRHSTDSSCAEELVRVHRSPTSPRFSDVRVRVPSLSLEVEEGGGRHHAHFDAHLNHHHRHPHLHPLQMHPVQGHHHHGLGIDDIKEVRLRGSGRKRTISSPCPPPPTREPSRCPPTSRPREPIYRTQIVEPTTSTTTVRASTRSALRSVQQERTRGTLRRVAGYEVLGKSFPWDWDCVSSTVGSSASGSGRWTRRRKPKGLKYPPFGSMERWL